MSNKTHMSAPSALIGAIITANGGPGKLHRFLNKNKIKVSYQSFVNWRTRGSVPLKHVLHIGELLGVSAYALNYIGFAKMTGEIPSWRKIVEETPIPSKTKKEILAKEHPVVDG